MFDDQTGQFKIGDFGNAVPLPVTRDSMWFRGTSEYAAPELFFKGPENGDAAQDLWSLGITFYAAATGTPMLPSGEFNQVDKFFRENAHLKNYEIHFGEQFKLCTFLYDVTKKLLTNSPKERLSAKDLHEQTHREIGKRLSMSR